MSKDLELIKKVHKIAENRRKWADALNAEDVRFSSKGVKKAFYKVVDKSYKEAELIDTIADRLEDKISET